MCSLAVTGFSLATIRIRHSSGYTALTLQPYGDVLWGQGKDRDSIKIGVLEVSRHQIREAESYLADLVSLYCTRLRLRVVTQNRFTTSLIWTSLFNIFDFYILKRTTILGNDDLRNQSNVDDVDVKQL